VDEEMIKREMEEQIRRKREQMIEIARQYGFTNEKTLKSSQELDKLLNKYQRFFRITKIRDYPTASLSINNLPDPSSLSA